MSNFFNEVLGDAKGMEKNLLGPNYEYWKQIYSPDELDMSDDGNLTTLANDIEGLIAYVELLVTGGGKASRGPHALGDKFFLKTGGQCTDTATGKKVDRYIYINNVPDGDIPFISAGMGGKTFSTFEGLIPSTLEDLDVLNPLEIMQAFMMGESPPCKQVTLETIDSNNNSSTETQYMATADIKNMEGFQNLNINLKRPKIDKSKLPNDKLVRIFYGALGVVGLYILYRLITKKK